MTQAMLVVGSASQLEFCTRASGVEVLVSLAERAPAVMRKCSSLAPGLLPLTLTLACEVGQITALITHAYDVACIYIEVWTAVGCSR